jgi:hypothetical protein
LVLLGEMFPEKPTRTDVGVVCKVGLEGA